MKNADKPANPITLDHIDGRDYKGLTKREMFAMAAMQGFLSGWPDHAGNVNPDAAASYAVSCADALLKQLEN